MTSLTTLTLYNGVDPSTQTTDEARGDAMGEFVEFLIDTSLPQTDNFITELNTLSEEIESYALDAKGYKETASGYNALCGQYKDLTLGYKNDAQTAKEAAEALLDAFDDRYLGSKATAPTVDNDGDALQNGALYHDTTAKAIYVYDLGTDTWIDMGLNPTSISAITGLQSALDSKIESLSDLSITVSASIINLLSGLNSNAQTQLNAKANLLGATYTGKVALKSTSFTTTVDCSLGNTFTQTVTANRTISFTNVPASGSDITIELVLTNGGAYTITWDSSVKWADATEPELTASGRDRIILSTNNGGTTWDAVPLLNFG